MLRLVVVSLGVAMAAAMVCTPDICSRVKCVEVTRENCPTGSIVAHGSECGCCTKCVTSLGEGDKCLPKMFRGVQRCGNGLVCDPKNYRCRKQQQTRAVNSKRQGPPTCAERLKQSKLNENNRPHQLSEFIPRCAADGSYAVSQCHGSVCFCMDPKGVELKRFRSFVWNSANMDCKCALDQYAYMRSSNMEWMNQHTGYSYFCATNGSYDRACHGTYCYCADKNGKKKPGSKGSHYYNVGSLRC